MYINTKLLTQLNKQCFINVINLIDQYIDQETKSLSMMIHFNYIINKRISIINYQ